MVEKTKNPETKWLVEILKGKYNPAVIDTQTLDSYSGKYGVRTITYEINTLCYQKQGQAKIKMIPISETTFSLENNTELKIEMVTENNKVIGFKRVFFDGMTEFSKRD
jgi:retinol-binding protein 3